MNAPLARYQFGAFELDPADKVLTHRGHPVALTPKAFDTLLVLVAVSYTHLTLPTNSRV